MFWSVWRMCKLACMLALGVYQHPQPWKWFPAPQQPTQLLHINPAYEPLAPAFMHNANAAPFPGMRVTPCPPTITSFGNMVCWASAHHCVYYSIQVVGIIIVYCAFSMCRHPLPSTGWRVSRFPTWPIIIWPMIL
jgi:hypothetical protein